MVGFEWKIDENWGYLYFMKPPYGDRLLDQKILLRFWGTCDLTRMLAGAKSQMGIFRDS